MEIVRRCDTTARDLHCNHIPPLQLIPLLDVLYTRAWLILEVDVLAPSFSGGAHPWPTELLK
eukprot:7395295-Karenia_brevis.AAC.1